MDLPRGGTATEAVLADADLAVLVVPARLRAATAARLLVEAPGSGWSAAQLVVRSVAGGLSPDEVADVVGRPVLGELTHDRSAVPRGERGEPPTVSARSPLGPRPVRARRRRGGAAVSAPPLLDRVRARLALEPGPPSRAEVAALVREEAGGLLGRRRRAADRPGRRRRAGRRRTTGSPRCARRRPPTSWSTGPSRSGWTGAPGWSAEVRFADEESVRRLAVRLAAAAGRRLDDASPWVDVGLPDGTRLHAVLPPVSATGTCLSLRVLRRSVHSLSDLASLGTLPGASEELLRALVPPRLAFLVTGGTGSGKTTLLSALLGEVDPAERMVLCEDADRAAPGAPPRRPLLTRPANVEGRGR